MKTIYRICIGMMLSLTMWSYIYASPDDVLFEVYNLQSGNVTEVLADDDTPISWEGFDGTLPIMGDELGDVVAPNIVIGDDERSVVNNPQNKTPYRSIGIVRATFENGTILRGTGFLVAPSRVVTSAHVCYKSEYGNAINVTFTPCPSGTFAPFGTISVSSTCIPYDYTYAFGPNSNEDVKSRYDYAVLILVSPIGDTVGYMGCKKPSNPVNKNVIVSGYSSDFQNGYMSKSSGIIGSADTWFYYYDNDTYNGDSGAPVFRKYSDGTYYAIGVHHGGATQTSNKCVRFTTQVLNFIANEYGFTSGN